MRIDIITIFPDYFAGPLGVSLIGKAAARGEISFHVHDLRRWAADVHHTVDDTPFGGGPGMVMKPDVWGAAIDAVLAANQDKVEEYRSGKDRLFGFLVGQSMKALAGKGNPALVNETLKRRLSA